MAFFGFQGSHRPQSVYIDWLEPPQLPSQCGRLESSHTTPTGQSMTPLLEAFTSNSKLVAPAFCQLMMRHHSASVGMSECVCARAPKWAKISTVGACPHFLFLPDQRSACTVREYGPEPRICSAKKTERAWLAAAKRRRRSKPSPRGWSRSGTRPCQLRLDLLRMCACLNPPGGTLAIGTGSARSRLQGPSVARGGDGYGSALGRNSMQRACMHAYCRRDRRNACRATGTRKLLHPREPRRCESAGTAAPGPVGRQLRRCAASLDPFCGPVVRAYAGHQF